MALGSYKSQIIRDAICVCDPDFTNHNQTGFVVFQSDGEAGGELNELPHAGALVDGETIRLGWEADPDGTGRCWVSRCHPTDADTAGVDKKRSEFSLAREDYNNEMTFGICMYLPDWSSTSDNQSVFQLHPVSAALSPALSCIVQGSEVRFVSRSDHSATPGSDVETIIQYTGTITPNVWDYWTIQYRQSDTEQASDYVKVWRNGSLIVDYTGPLGYKESGQPYWKCGYYHWLTDNAWDVTINLRETRFKGPLVIERPQTHTHEMYSALRKLGVSVI